MEVRLQGADTFVSECEACAWVTEETPTPKGLRGLCCGIVALFLLKGEKT